jgi:hypothetical protein
MPLPLEQFFKMGKTPTGYFFDSQLRDLENVDMGTGGSEARRIARVFIH